jgi:diguanylate cyclase (GGDEF)-like protein/PAS domain S-box-containing protein
MSPNHDPRAPHEDVDPPLAALHRTTADPADLLPAQGPVPAGAPTATLSLAGELLQTSHGLLSLLGAEAQLAGSCIQKLGSTAADREALSAMIAAACDGVDGDEAAVQLLVPGRPPLPVSICWSLVRDSRGAPSYLRSAWFVDHTGQQDILGHEARWRALLEHAADITWTAEADGRITSATDGMLDQLGWRQDELSGACAFDFVHPGEQHTFRVAWDRLVSGSSRREVVECRVARADGGWTWMRETLTDRRGDPHVRAIVGNVLDITTARHERLARARQDAHLRARFEQSSVPQATVGPDLLLSAVNDALSTLVGRPAALLLDQPVEVLHHPDDPGRFARSLADLFSGRRDNEQAEATLAGPDGRALPVLADLTLLRDEAGRPAGAALFWHDLSRLRLAEQRQRQQEEFFLALSQRANDVALVTDTGGCLLYVSPSVGHLLGHQPHDLLGSDAWDFVHPEDLEAARAALAAAVDNGSGPRVQVRVRDATGGWRHVEVVATNLLSTAVGGIVCNLVDVTARVEAERALRSSEARYRAIADTAGEGIWAVSPTGRTLYVNARMASILGMTVEQAYARDATTLLDDDDVPQMLDRLATRSARGEEHYEVPYRHPDAGERILAIAATPLHDAEGELEGSLAMVSDVTDARRVELELRHATVHDALTGLPNRTLLLDRLEHALGRETIGTAAIFVDLDHFKLVNDSHGHGCGDQLLIAVADRLRQAVRVTDTVARFGSDEFVVVCEDVDQSAADAMAAELLDALDEAVQLEFGPVHVTASIGLAVSPARTAGDLLRFADAAMHAAKASGGGRVRRFDVELEQKAELEHSLATDLRTALAGDELALHYQPVVELRTGRVVGMEALARWQHPVHGLVPPSRFVAVADRCGLTAELDAWVLRRALAEAGSLHDRGEVPHDAYVAVNVSARNLSDPRLEEVVVSSAAAAGLSPTGVVLEITEGAIMDDPDVSIALLRRLRDHGFGIAIDDFGTGYSSLAYLRELPITLLKIDRSFIGHITQDRDARAIAASIIDLARGVGVTVVAEGVETAEQAALLHQFGCHAGQGWLWSTAIAPAQIAASESWTSGFEPAPGTSTRPGTRASTRPAQPVTADQGLPRMMALHHTGASLATIAAALNREGYRAPTGVRWHSTSVARAIEASAYPMLQSEQDASASR